MVVGHNHKHLEDHNNKAWVEEAFHNSIDHTQVEALVEEVSTVLIP